MKKIFIIISTALLGIIIVLHYTLFAAYAQQQPTQAPNQQITPPDFTAQVNQARNKLATIMREINFAKSDFDSIKRALEQNKSPITRLTQTFDDLQNRELKSFRSAVAAARQNMANAGRILKEARDKFLSISSEARQSAAEAQRLARSTDEIERSAGLAKKLDALIKQGDSLLTSMQNQLNKIEVISTGLGK